MDNILNRPNFGRRTSSPPACNGFQSPGADAQTYYLGIRATSTSGENEPAPLPLGTAAQQATVLLAEGQSRPLVSRRSLPA